VRIRSTESRNRHSAAYAAGVSDRTSSTVSVPSGSLPSVQDAVAR
jgi:hypothetical protein